MNARTAMGLAVAAALVGVGVGCSPAGYSRSADLQVADILRDRTRSTIGYTPEVDVQAEVPAKPTKGAYEKIPVSPIPPVAGPPMELERIEVPFEPLGPDLRWKDAAAVEAEYVETSVVERQLNEREPLGPPITGQMARKLDVLACVEYAVQHSRSYQNEMEDLYLSALDVTLARHLFSPRPFVRQSFTINGGAQDVEHRTALTAATSVGVRQRLPYGGEVVAQGLVNFVDAISENAEGGESADLVLSGSLPLLRGAGMVNLEGLISSERNIVYQVRGFEDFRRSFVVDIASRYFTLLAQQQGIVNRRLSVVNLAQLTERTQALYDAGKIGFLEVQRSLQSQLSAESALIDAEEQYQTALDNFKIALGMPVDEVMDVVPVELDVKVPQVTVDEAIATAHQYRLDLRTAADRIDDAQRGVANARNGLLPTVDLVGSVSAGNTDGRPARALNDDTGRYSAGVSIDLPIDRVAERNSYRSALIRLQQAQRSYDDQRDRVTANVRDSLRTIRSALTNVDIQRRGIELAQKRLEFSSVLLQQGKINARDVVESQTSLLDAQDRFNRAKAQLQIRVLEYMRDTGTLRIDPSAGAIGRVLDRVPNRIVLPGKTLEEGDAPVPRQVGAAGGVSSAQTAE